MTEDDYVDNGANISKDVLPGTWFWKKLGSGLRHERYADYKAGRYDRHPYGERHRELFETMLALGEKLPDEEIAKWAAIRMGVTDADE